jgi:polyisoprenoid-binding protein YceI
MHSTRRTPQEDTKPRRRWGLESFLAAALLAAAGPGTAAPVELHVQPDSSRVEYHITNPLGDVTNVAGPASGSVHADRSGTLALTGRVSVDLRQLTTGIGMRDHHVKSKSYLDVEQYPYAEFELREAAPDSGRGDGGHTPSLGNGRQALATGTLRLHGVTREVEIPVSLDWQQSRLRVRGSFTIALQDYGIPRPKRLVIVAGKTVDVRLDLLLVP